MTQPITFRSDYAPTIRRSLRAAAHRLAAACPLAALVAASAAQGAVRLPCDPERETGDEARTYGLKGGVAATARL